MQQVEIIRNNVTVAGPMPFEASRVRDIVMRQGGDYRLVPNGLNGPRAIGGINLLPVRVAQPALTRMQTYGPPERVVNEEAVTYTYPVVDRETGEVRDELKEALARHHEDRDQGRFEHRGVMIANDLEARINAKGVLEAFESGALTNTHWRGRALTNEDTDEEGPNRIPVASAQEMKAIYDAIFGRLNACFAAREAVDEMLNTASDEGLAALDVRAEFDAVLNAIMAQQAA